MDGWRTLIETTTRSAVEHGAAVRRRTDVDGRLQFEAAGDACSEHVQGSPRRGLGAERGVLRSVRRAGRPGDAGQRRSRTPTFAEAAVKTYQTNRPPWRSRKTVRIWLQ